jgi:hypothetical protein
MPAKPEQPDKPECCFCFASNVPLMNVGEGDKPPFTYAKAWMLAAGTTEIHACQRCFTERDDCFGVWKPRPKLRRTTCGKAPEYFEEEHGTTILCPDAECECDFIHETTPERAVKVWNNPD